MGGFLYEVDEMEGNLRMEKIIVDEMEGNLQMGKMIVDEMEGS
jgi:hypothetical protein